jgi:hypothetical protein
VSQPSPPSAIWCQGKISDSDAGTQVVTEPDAPG